MRGDVARVQVGDPIGPAAGSLDPALSADPNRVKVVVDARGRAVYFSRAAVPCDRDGTGAVVYHQHVGVSAYTPDALARWLLTAPVPAGRWERLGPSRRCLHRAALGVSSCPATASRG